MKLPAFSARTIPLALLLLCLASFGPLSPWLGFYWDDWPTVWYLHVFGASGFAQVFASDRPLLAWVFTLFAPLFSDNLLAWHIFTLLGRWLACLVVWKLLRTVWPQHTRLAAWTVVLYAVYPGFLQQPIAVTYSTAWITQIAFFGSFLCMVWAVRAPSTAAAGPSTRTPASAWLYGGLSLVLAAYAMFADEYYFGLELLRPLVLWAVLIQPVPAPAPAGTPAPPRTPFSQVAGAWLRQVAIPVGLRWAPYLALMIVFLVWRLVLHESPRGQVQLLDPVSRSPLFTLLDLLQTIAANVVESGLRAWLWGFNLLPELGLPRRLLLALAAGTGLLTSLYLARLRFREPEDAPPLWPIHFPGWIQPAAQFAGLGLFALLVAGWPFWVTRLPVELRFPWDRFNLAFMLGSSLLLAGLVAWLLKKQWAQSVALGLLVALAVGAHFANADRFRQDWAIQRQFFWQLTWRAPAIQPGTVLLTAQMPFRYFSDNSLTAPLNWTYAPQHQGQQMPYLLVDIQSRLGLQLSDLKKDLPIHQEYRATYFDGSTSELVAVYMPPEGCLKVFNPHYDALYPLRQEMLESAKVMSDPGRVFVEDHGSPARPPDALGPEPAHDWCFYFEQAELARQQGDWETAAQFSQQALKLPVKRISKEGKLAYATEFAPFVEAHGHIGQWAEAQRLTLLAIQNSPRATGYLCATWRRMLAATPASPERDAAFTEVNRQLQCPVPQ